MFITKIRMKRHTSSPEAAVRDNSSGFYVDDHGEIFEFSKNEYCESVLLNGECAQGRLAVLCRPSSFFQIILKVFTWGTPWARATGTRVHLRCSESSIVPTSYFLLSCLLYLTEYFCDSTIKNFLFWKSGGKTLNIK